MKCKRFAGMCITAAIVLLSCHSKKDDPTKALVGKWGFVTIADSSKKDTALQALVPLAATMVKNDTTANGIEFNTDSSYHIYSGKNVKDSGKYYVDSSNLTLYIRRDSTYQPLKIKKLTGSTMEFILVPDSLSMQLRRKK